MQAAVVIASLFGLFLSGGALGARSFDAAAATTAPAAESAFVKVKIERDGKVTEHPGYRIEHGVEEVFAIQEGGKTHEITVLIRGVEGGKFDVAVTYVVHGKQQGSADLALDAGRYGEFTAKGTKVGVFLDPQGDVDKSRKEKIDKPKSGAPLD